MEYSTEVELMRAYWANSRDKTPLTPYADWLDEHASEGQPGWPLGEDGMSQQAALIRLECQLAADNDPKNKDKLDPDTRAALVAQRDALREKVLRAMHEKWDGCVPENVTPPIITLQDGILRDVQFHRGSVTLPENGWIEGDLKISEQAHCNPIPSNLRIGHGCYLKNNTSLNALPGDMQIGGTLDIDESNIAQLPENWRLVELYANGTQKLIHLPDGLNVEGSINGNHSNIQYIGKETQAGRLSLVNSKVEDVPADLKVRGMINFSHCPIKLFPSLSSLGNLCLEGCKNLESLSDNMHIKDVLFIRNTPLLKDLPSGLIIDGNLYMTGSGVTHLPDDLCVKGQSIHISPRNFSKEEIESWPERLTKVSFAARRHLLQQCGREDLIERVNQLEAKEVAVAATPGKATLVGSLAQDKGGLGVAGS